MIATGTVLVVLALYVAGTFLVAQWGERTAAGRRWAAHPLSYALGLTVYCTTWTYYGSVGRGATGGIAYLPVYLGPTLAMLLGSGVLERMAALKRAHRLTSVADFISARYGKSEGVAALVTGLLSIGIVPYLALQLKALNDTFALLTAGPGGDASMVQLFGPACAVAMVVFTILFGLRHLDPTERHPGMVVSVAFEAVVKLTAFLASGALVLALVFDGPAGFFARLDELGAKLPTLTVSPAPEVLSWFTVTLLAAAAFFFLPRQFHVGVVESSAPEHARFARWATPAYLLLINVLVLPIALGGASLALPGVRPDQFVLALPVHAGARALALFVFVGGFSAAIGMIMVEAMTMATMISNHLVLPVVARVPALRALERRVLPIRWTAVAGLVGAAYVFQAVAGGSSTLVAIGLISFAAAFLLAPVTLLGLFWREASKGGALVGLAAGGLTWFYTLMVPTFVKSQWLPKSLLDQGPWGIGLLRPEALMGWEGLPNLPHGVIFSALALLVGFVVGNALFPAGAEERLLTEAFLDPDKKGIEHLDARRRVIEAAGRRALARGILGRVFPSAEVDVILARCEQAAGIPADATHLTASEEAELHREVERSLAGAIGAPSAHHAMKAWGGIDRKDQGAVIREFARLIAEMRMSPRELKERIDAQGEKDAQLDAQFKELERRVEERTREIQTILNHVVFGFLVIDRALHVQPGYTRSCHELFGGSDLAGRRLDALLGVEGTREGASLELSIDAVFDDMLPEVVLVDQIPRRFPMPVGTVLHLEGRVVRDEAGAVVGVLVSVQDATLLEQTQAETKKQRVLLEILRNRGPFKTFIGDARVRLESALSLVGDPAQQPIVRREVHTLKGNAGAYGLDRIVAALHAIEEEPAIGADALRSVRGLFLEFLDENRAVLGMSLGEGEDEFVVRQAQLLELRDLVLQLPAPTSGPIVDWSRRVAQKPLAELLGPVDLVAAKLAERLEKDVRVVTAGLEVEVAPELWRPMSQALMHLVRNALDHGVETPDDRGTKPRQATLAIRAEVRGDEVALVLEDDGRGIDGWRLAQKAVSRGQLSPEAADALDEAGRLELMFLDGLSTAEQATDVSGRGVGMSAVRAEVERLGGRLEIRTVVGEGTAFSIVLPRYGLTADLVVGAAGGVVPRRDEARAPGA